MVGVKIVLTGLLLRPLLTIQFEFQLISYYVFMKKVQFIFYM